MLIILSLPVYEHGLISPFIWFFDFVPQNFVVFLMWILYIFGRFIPKYFVFGGADTSGVFFYFWYIGK